MDSQGEECQGKGSRREPESRQISRSKVHQVSSRENSKVMTPQRTGHFFLYTRAAEEAQPEAL